MYCFHFDEHNKLEVDWTQAPVCGISQEEIICGSISDMLGIFCCSNVSSTWHETDIHPHGICHSDH